MQVVIVQPDTVWEDREANFENVRRLLDARPPEAGALVVLPEMFAVGFTMNVEAAAEPSERPTERFLAELAKKYACAVVGGVVGREPDGRGRNEALVVDDRGEVLARYVKIHPFSYAGEDAVYRSGDWIAGFDWGGFRVAPFVCYDLRFPEVYRAAALGGAEVLVTIANFPTPRHAHWTQLLAARAIENQAYSVGVNRAGRDPNVAYSGGSRVVGPEGHVLCEAGRGEGVWATRIDREALAAYRERFPALRDARWTDLKAAREGDGTDVGRNG